MMWSTALACALLVIFVVQDASAKRKKDRFCNNPKKYNGMLYARHPFDCSKYIRCVQKGRNFKAVFEKCDFGNFWDHGKFKCLPSNTVYCPYDKCKKPSVEQYKHLDPNKCSAYYKCYEGKAYANCCPKGEGFHSKLGCVAMKNCKSMCALRDRVPGCKRIPKAGAPTQFYEYAHEGKWKRRNCYAGDVFNAPDCECSLQGLIKKGRVCKPDVVINFNDGVAKDVSRNDNEVQAFGIQYANKTAYFNGRAKLTIGTLKPSKYDEGVLIIKMKYKEIKSKRWMRIMQGLVTNGHCNTSKPPSVIIAKKRQFVMMGCEAKTDYDYESKSESLKLATVDKEWKEVIFIKNSRKIEGRVCGAAGNTWATGPIVDTNCGFQIGQVDGLIGFLGYLDEISIYRCSPLDAVVNLTY